MSSIISLGSVSATGLAVDDIVSLTLPLDVAVANPDHGSMLVVGMAIDTSFDVFGGLEDPGEPTLFLLDDAALSFPPAAGYSTCHVGLPLSSITSDGTPWVWAFKPIYSFARASGYRFHVLAYCSVLTDALAAGVALEFAAQFPIDAVTINAQNLRGVTDTAAAGASAETFPEGEAITHNVFNDWSGAVYHVAITNAPIGGIHLDAVDTVGFVEPGDCCLSAIVTSSLTSGVMPVDATSPAFAQDHLVAGDDALGIESVCATDRDGVVTVKTVPVLADYVHGHAFGFYDPGSPTYDVNLGIAGEFICDYGTEAHPLVVTFQRHFRGGTEQVRVFVFPDGGVPYCEDETGPGPGPPPGLGEGLYSWERF